MANRAFIRFNNLTIPNYSEVSNVYARFTAYSDKSSAPVNLRCAFVNEDNPDAPTSEAELQAFTLTDWVSWNTLESWTDGTEYDTPDLTDILQSIINRIGWSNGNSVILVIEDVGSSEQRGFSSIQFGSGEERAVLFVTYLAREGQAGSSIGLIIQQDIISSNIKRHLARTSNGDLHCVYKREIGSVQQLCYAKSINGGEIWSETVLTSGSYAQNNPSIAVDSSDYIHVVWESFFSGDSERQIRHIKFTTIWSSPTLLSNAALGSNQKNPSIAIDSNDYLHVVWAGVPPGSSYQQIRYIKYTTSWQSIEELTTTEGSSYQQYFPCIAIDSNDNLHVVMTGGVGVGYTQIRYIKYTMYTMSWQSIEELTTDTNYVQYSGAFIAIDSNDNLHVVWSGNTGETNRQIRYIKYDTSWGSIINLTDGSYVVTSSILSISGNDNIYVIFSGKHIGSPDYFQLRLISYTTSWSEITNITFGNFNQYSTSPIWAMHPTIGGLKTNITNTGFAFVWSEQIVALAFPYYRTDFKYYASDDLIWET